MKIKLIQQTKFKIIGGFFKKIMKFCRETIIDIDHQLIDWKDLQLIGTDCVDQFSTLMITLNICISCSVVIRSTRHVYRLQRSGCSGDWHRWRRKPHKTLSYAEETHRGFSGSKKYQLLLGRLIKFVQINIPLKWS